MLTFLAGNLLMFTVMAVSLWIGLSHSSPQSSNSTALTPFLLRPSSPGTAQPWGKLESMPLPFAEADDIESLCGRFMGEPKWVFSGVTRIQLLRYFLSLHLRYQDRQVLLDPRRWQVTSFGIEISPPESVVYALDPASRGKIYAALAGSAANQMQRQAIILPRITLDAQLRALGLNECQIIRLKHLTYTMSGHLCLSDLAVAEKILGPKAFQNLVEYLFSLPAYRVRLKVTPASDIDTLAAYWGRGGREELIKPLLKSLARVPGGTDQNISALLPDFARLRLYRYANLEHDGPTAANQDCIFSAMNFFREVPDTNFLNPAYVTEALSRDYEGVTNALTLGDLILMQNSQGKVIHICVYIADEFVFTKNGASPTQPWVLMKMDDTLNIYSENKSSAEIRLLRLKASVTAKSTHGSA